MDGDLLTLNGQVCAWWMGLALSDVMSGTLVVGTRHLGVRPFGAVQEAVGASAGVVLVDGYHGNDEGAVAPSVAGAASFAELEADER